MVAALVAALLALGLMPALAAAQIFEVNSLNDGAKTEPGAVCKATFPGECTLRAAIQAANVDSDPDEITFSTAIFNGVAGADEIEPETALPTITEPVSIVGRALVSGAILKPSVGVKAPAGAASFKVLADEVAISHVAVGGGEAGIEVLGTSDRFTALGDWFGLRLDASAQAITGAGLSLGTAADEATIGSGEFGLATGNVFGNAAVGIEVKGASDATIQGNYIGVQPDGTGAAGLDTGVRIEDFAAPAERDEIGGVLGPAERAAQECIGPCNAIAVEGGGAAIDLAGSATDPHQAAHGPTYIRGNFIGLEPDGAGTVGEATYGVLAAPSEPGCVNGPGEVTVGGEAAGAGNFFVGGTFGIEAEAAEGFSAVGNAIGINPDGSAAESPGAVGISLCNEGVTEPGLVAGNRMILGPDTVGVESSFGQAQILGNSIQGGFNGIVTRDAGVGGGNIIQSNTVTGSDRQGILITDELNLVIGNVVSGSGWSGIQIEEGGEDNRIGGDGLGEANTINGTGSGNVSGAILIEGTESSRNEVAANTGSGNFGSFIELVGHGSSETPNGLRPPSVTAARQSSAEGTAAPNTTVRVFIKASTEPGELGELLAVVKADAAGAWTTTYATQPVGTLIAATQTSDAGTAVAGTSEVSAPTAAVADPPKPPEPEPEKKETGGGAPPAGNPVPISTPAPKVPTVKITSAPKRSSSATTAKFMFKAEPAAGAKFECKLDGSKWAKCRSPKTYRKLAPGRHTFRVRAVASAGTSAVGVFRFTITR